MTSNHARKQLVRDRMAASGETYTQARQALEPEPPFIIQVSIPIGVIKLSRGQQDAWLAAEREKEHSGQGVVNDIVEAYLKQQQEGVDREDTDNIGFLSQYCDIDIETLWNEQVISATPICLSEADARYAAVQGHKARALGITIDEYRERERWLNWDLTEAEEQWLADTGRIVYPFTPDEEGYEIIWAEVNRGPAVMATDEMMVQFLAEYKAR